MWRFLLFLNLPVLAADIEWLDDAVLKRAEPAVAIIYIRDAGGGFGFFASEDGLVVTLAGMLEGNEKLKIVSSTGEEIFGSELMAIDREADLAVLATHKKPPAFLSVEAEPTKTGEPCATFYLTPLGDLNIADGQFLARVASTDVTKSRLMDHWSIAVNPKLNGGLAGAPVINSRGRVTGLVHLDSRGWVQRFTFAVPQEPVSALLARARKARQPMKFPAIGEITQLSAETLNPDVIAANHLNELGDRQGAALRLREALKRDPENAELMGSLAGTLVLGGEFAEARHLMEEKMRRQPADMTDRESMGKILASEGDPAKAAAYYQQLVNDYPRYAEAWGCLANHLDRSGRKDEALSACKKWVELRPDSILSWRLYADLLLELERFDEASVAREREQSLESLFFKLQYSAPKRNL